MERYCSTGRSPQRAVAPTEGGGGGGGCSEVCRYKVDKYDQSMFYHQLMHKRIALKGVLKFTLKQFRHVSV